MFYNYKTVIYCFFEYKYIINTRSCNIDVSIKVIR